MIHCFTYNQCFVICPKATIALPTPPPWIYHTLFSYSVLFFRLLFLSYSLLQCLRKLASCLYLNRSQLVGLQISYNWGQDLRSGKQLLFLLRQIYIEEFAARFLWSNAVNLLTNIRNTISIWKILHNNIFL